MNIYAAATRSEIEGHPIILSYINSLHCKSSWSQEVCHQGRQSFSERIFYVQLRTPSDYQLLHTKIFHPEETLRIFYLSVSPSLYQAIAFNIDQFSRPSNEIRVVFEKPFGMVTECPPPPPPPPLTLVRTFPLRSICQQNLPRI
jgi:glucose-6-phosphate 1-dehydrogenase